MTDIMAQGSFSDGTALFDTCAMETEKVKHHAGIPSCRNQQYGGFIMKEHFLDRLYGEYQAYRASLLSCPNVEIFNRCYEIDAVVSFYEILMEKAAVMSDRELEVLLKRKNLLMELYDLWLKRDDSAYSEMEMHIESGIRNMTKEISGR